VRVVAKYRGPGMGEWKSLELPKTGGGWGALVPCGDVERGTFQYYIQGFNAANDPVATSGSRNKPYSVPVKSQIAGPPPSLPDQEPPRQCGGADRGERGGERAGDECPPDFPGCKEQKAVGEACQKDSQCKTNLCVEGTCAEKLAKGDSCERDEQCTSGSCVDGSCSSGSKKAEGEDCSYDDECETGVCKLGACSTSGTGKFPRLWIGLGGSLDFFVMPGTTDACKLDPSGRSTYTAGNPYSCVDPSTGVNFPNDPMTNNAIPPHSDQVQSGVTHGNLRLLVSVDFALSTNVLLGLRAGYELFTNPASGVPGAAFAPIHVEGRFTYLFGRNAITQSVAPLVLLAAGVGEFDAYVPVPVFTSATMPVPPITENAWVTAGPGFAAVGPGVRFLLGKSVATTVALKLEGAFGGSAGLLLGMAPELGIQFGF
jgi:hypothetical protein